MATTAALAAPLTLAAAIICICIRFQRGTHTRRQLVANDGTGAPSLTDMGARFAIAAGWVMTLYIAAPPNGSSKWVRVVHEVSGAVFEQVITADVPILNHCKLHTLDVLSCPGQSSAVAPLALEKLISTEAASGNKDGRALLFEMKVLFGEYVDHTGRSR